MVHKKARKEQYQGVRVKGILLSPEEYKEFVQYLNERRVQKFTKQDLSNWLESKYSSW